MMISSIAIFFMVSPPFKWIHCEKEKGMVILKSKMGARGKKELFFFGVAINLLLSKIFLEEGFLTDRFLLSNSLPIFIGSELKKGWMRW
jgi:hypothetical protein